MQQTDRTKFAGAWARFGTLAALLPALGACADFAMPNFNPIPRVENMVSNSSLAFPTIRATTCSTSGRSRRRISSVRARLRGGRA